MSAQVLDEKQKGWKKVTLKEAQELDKAGKLAGFDDVAMVADIRE